MSATSKYPLTVKIRSQVHLTRKSKNSMDALPMEMIIVPMSAVLKMLDCLCSDCQETVRRHLAANQRVARHDLDLRLEEIVNHVCQELGTTHEELLSTKKDQRIVESRRRVALLARQQGFSLPRIGAALQRHHTTILALIQPKKNRLTPHA